jgi:hypothetical protein
MADRDGRRKEILHIQNDVFILDLGMHVIVGSHVLQSKQRLINSLREEGMELQSIKIQVCVLKIVSVRVLTACTKPLCTHAHT